MVNGANLSCGCSRSPMGFSPHCHVGDGCVDVILVRHTSFFNNIRMLLRLSSKQKTLVLETISQLLLRIDDSYRWNELESLNFPSFESPNFGEFLRDERKVKCRIPRIRQQRGWLSLIDSICLFSQYDLPFVEVYRAREFTFRALPTLHMQSNNEISSRYLKSSLSVWNCDGEVIDSSNVKIR